MRMSADLPDTPVVLEAVLEGFVQAAAAEVAAGMVPPYPDVAGVKYVEEPGTENWKLPHQTLSDGQGDCEDLAIWEAAGMRVLGEDPTASVVLVKTGPKKLHAVVMLADGRISDPSARLKVRQDIQAKHKLGSMPILGARGLDGDFDDNAWWFEDGLGPDTIGGVSCGLGIDGIGAVQVIARNDLKTTSGKGFGEKLSRPNRGSSGRAFAGQEGTRVNINTGEQLVDASSQRFLPGDPNAPPGYDPYSPYQYPPGYYPPGGAFPGYPGQYPGQYPYSGYPPYTYQQSAPMPYGNPFDNEPMYGYSSDYWGTGGDSPYGWAYGNAPLVTYEDLYGNVDLPEQRADPIGMDDMLSELMQEGW